ncbi:MAG: hypothetical protein LC637_11010 [Xanthomonadaceae bacterium]|nr:hypothetical protein [Xanthomonadaceae bacterium]
MAGVTRRGFAQPMAIAVLHNLAVIRSRTVFRAERNDSPAASLPSLKCDCGCRNEAFKRQLSRYFSIVSFLIIALRGSGPETLGV